MSRYELCKFSPAPDPELICGICMNVLDTPYETPCRHVFCCGCISTALKENPKCPLCRTICTEDMLKEVLPLVQNLINKLTMRCDNYDSGCKLPITKEFFLDHIKSCDYAIVQCRFTECRISLLRKYCDDHERNICAYRDHICQEGCGLIIPLDKVESHNCIGALLTLVTELKEKNTELLKANDELKRTLPHLAQIEPPVPANVNHEDQYSYITSDDDSLSYSSHPFSSNEVSEYDISDFEYENYSTGLRRSSRLAALSLVCGSVDNEVISGHSNHSQSSHVSRNSNNNAENSNIFVGILNEDNNLETLEYQITEEIRGHSEHSNGSNSDYNAGGAVSSEVHSQTDDNGNSLYTESVLVTSHKRSNEETIGACSDDGVKSMKRMRQAHANEYKETHAKKTSYLSESQSGSSFTNAEPLALTRKRPFIHKKYNRISNSNSSSIVDDGNSSSSTNSTQTTHHIHTTEPCSSDSTDTLNSSTSNRSEHISITSRHGPVTRSRGQDDHILLDNVIPYVKVPPTVAYLLNKYTQDDDSSEDESWSPDHEK